MTSEFDVGLIFLDSRLTTFNIPGKMLSYMSSSMPILAAISPGNDLKHILEESQAGLVCRHGDRQKLRDYVLLLTRDARLRRQMGKNARILLKKTFSVSRAASQIIQRAKELQV
jgi:hypothetical protein